MAKRTWSLDEGLHDASKRELVDELRKLQRRQNDVTRYRSGGTRARLGRKIARVARELRA